MIHGYPSEAELGKELFPGLPSGMRAGRFLTRTAIVCSLLLASALAEIDVQPLIARLASEDYSERERVTSELVRLGAENVEAVQQACLDHYLHDADPEIRKRCETVLRRLLVKSVGFLGLRHQQRSYFDEEGEERHGVEVIDVLPGQQADKAKLKPGDIIVSLQGVPLDETITAEEFGRRIRMLGAGKAVTFEVDRDGQRLEVQATTGAAPDSLVAADPGARFDEWLKSKTGKDNKPAAPKP